MAWCCASCDGSDLAADVMEDAYLQIWRRAGEFDPTIQSPMAWMVAMARSRAIDLVRQSSAAGGDGEPDIAEMTTTGRARCRATP